MKKIKSLVLLLVAVFALTMVGGFLHVKTDTAKAEKANGFYMADGARVKEITQSEQDGVDHNGIRFETTITQEKYTELENNVPSGGSLSFYTLVNIEDSKNELAYGKADYTVEWTWKGDFDGESEYTRKTALYNFPETMYRTLFTARSCYVIENAVGEAVEIGYAKETGVARSMEGVALAHLADNANDVTELKRFGGYIGLSVKEGQTLNGVKQTIVEPIYYGKNRLEEATQTVVIPNGLTGDVKMYSGAKQIGFTDENGKLVVSNADLENGKIYTITDGKGIYAVTVQAVDYAIGTAKEFAAWAKSVVALANPNSTTAKYAVLTDNIDLTSEVFLNTRWDTKPAGKNSHDGFGYGYLCGEFDGQGYTVDGLEHYRTGLFAGVAKGGYTFKNVALTNIKLSKIATGDHYVFGTHAYGAFTFENVYLQVKGVGGAAATDIISLNNYKGETPANEYIVVKDSVFDFAFTYAAGAPTYTKANIFYAKEPASVENFFGISATNLKKNSDTLTGTNYGRYANFTAYMADYAELAQNFDTKYWDAEENVLMFTTARQYVYNSYTVTVPFEVSGVSGNTLYAGNRYPLSTSMNNVTFSLKEAVRGVTISGESLSVADTARHGETVTVVATYTHPTYGYTRTTEKQFTLSNLVGFDITVNGEGKVGNYVQVGEYTLSAINSGATFSLEETPYGVSLNGNVLTVASGAVNGASIVLTASYFDEEEGKLYQGEYDCTVFNVTVPFEIEEIEPDEDTLRAGGQYTLSSAMTNVTFSLKSLVSGVTLEGNSLTIAKTATNGAELTIVATYTHPYEPTLTAQSEWTYRIEVTKDIFLTINDTQTIGVNQTYFTFDLSNYGEFTTSDLTSVTLDGVHLDTTEIQFAKNKLSVPIDGNFEIGNSYTLVATIANYTFTFTSFEVVEYAISTAEEMLTFVDTYIGTDINAVLINSISMKGKKWQAASNTYFSGTLDGRGYTVSDISVSSAAMFWGVMGATIKNIAFVNVTQTRTSKYTSLLCWNTSGSTDTTISNVYVQGTILALGDDVTEMVAGLVYSGSSFTIKNTFVDVEFNKSGFGAIAYTNTDHVSNVYAVSTTTTNFGAKTLSSLYRGGLYTSREEMASKKLNLSAFSSAYWDVASGYPVWKQAAAQVQTGKIDLGDYDGLHVYNKEVVTGANLVQNGSTDYKLVVPNVSAAYVTEFKKLWKEATGGTITAVSSGSMTSATSGKYIFIGCSTHDDTAGLDINDDLPNGKTINAQGFRIRTVEGDVYVSALTEEGAQWGAYELLTQLFGYERYGVDYYTIEKKTTVPLYNFDVADNPDFETRIAPYGSIYEEESKANLMRFVTPSNVYIGTRYHNTLIYLPKSSGDSAWYSDNGEQLCYTAHGDDSKYQAMVEAMKNACIKQLKNVNPVKGAVMTITQMDNRNFCTCAACVAANTSYGGNLSGRIWKFHLDLVKALNAWLTSAENTTGWKKDDLLFAAFAYQNTQQPPAYQNVENERIAYEGLDARGDDSVSNAAIFYAISSGDYLHGLNDLEYNSSVKSAIDGWKACTNNAGVWLYQTNYLDYLIPTNTFAYQDTYKMCLDLGAKWIFDQGQHNNGNSTGFSNFKMYLNSKLQWNVNLDVETLTRNYFNATYGDATSTMKSYYDSVMAHMLTIPASQIEQNMTSRQNFPKAKVKEWYDLVQQAKEEAKGTDAYDRVCLDGLSAEYLYLKYYATEYGMTASELSTARADFVSRARELGVTRADQSTYIQNIVW